MKPNLLLITVDQMRFDCLHYLNHPVIQTPNLDHLASRGVTFTSAYSATPSCVPARASIITGMSQRSHGRVGYQDNVPWTYEHTLPGELADAGYHTQCIGKMHVYPTRNLCGFHNIELHDGYMHYNRNRARSSALEWWDYTDDYLPWLRERAGYDQDIMDQGLDCNASVVSKPWHLEEKYHPTNWAVTRSIDFLRRRDPGKPFFLWTSFVRPHSPLDPPQAYLDLYKNIDLPEPPIGDWADTEDADKAGFNPTTGRGIVHDRMRKDALAAYYALITHIDNQIGRLLNALFEFGVSDNTVIMFTSDHGDLMGDHNLYQKRLAYEGSAKVPFILCDPTGKLGLESGKIVNQVVEMRDIMPTLLDVANIAIPDSVDGSSVLPLSIRNNGEKLEWREFLHGEHAHGPMSYHYATDGKRKYIWYSQTGVEQYFNLEADPQELHNLINDAGCADEISGWRNRVVHELIGREEGYTDGVQLITGRPPQNVLRHIL